MQKNISISPALTAKHPQTYLGVLRYKANVVPTTKELNETLTTTVATIQNQYKLEDIAKLKEIANTRTAYKALGKSPSEYRNSAEALLRRAVKNLGLYQINTVVDTGNLFSLLTGFSVGSYDFNKVTGDITLGQAKEGDHYEGIGKASVNIGNLPVLFDQTGAFGNPCSDSLKTMVTKDTTEVLTIIYAFCPINDLLSALDKYENLLKTYCDIQIIEKHIVTP